jgi:hypothetical protein
VGDFSVEISGVRSLVLRVFGESEAGGTGLLGVLGTGARIWDIHLSHIPTTFLEGI